MAQHQNRNVLIVDDDEIILVALYETISSEGYSVIKANNPKEGLKRLEEETFSVILSDQRMPEMTGLEFFNKAKDIQPNASRILITGVLTLKTVIEAVNKGEIFRFLAKPWIREELLATVHNANQRYQLIEMNEKLQRDTLKLNDQLAEANQKLKKQLDETVEQKEQLDKAHNALSQNFNRSLELCYRLISSFYPILGKQTKAIVDICQQMRLGGVLSEEEQHVMVTSAWLQNIGLLGISREILSRALNAPQELNEDEKQIIQHHPIYGQTLANFLDELEAVGTTIRAHHERWDGTGYPDGLARLMIPKPARYLAVAVHYVESGLPKEEAIEEILGLSGKAFDPEAVRLFLKVTRLTQLPKKIKEVLFSELSPGMVLAKGIYSPAGLLLIPEGQSLTRKTLTKITEHNEAEPIDQRLLVYI